MIPLLMSYLLMQKSTAKTAGCTDLLSPRAARDMAQVMDLAQALNPPHQALNLQHPEPKDERFEKGMEEADDEREESVEESEERTLNSRDRARFIEAWSRGELSAGELEALGVTFEHAEDLEIELNTAELQRSRGVDE